MTKSKGENNANKLTLSHSHGTKREEDGHLCAVIMPYKSQYALVNVSYS